MSRRDRPASESRGGPARLVQGPAGAFGRNPRYDLPGSGLGPVVNPVPDLLSPFTTYPSTKGTVVSPEPLHFGSPGETGTGTTERRGPLDERGRGYLTLYDYLGGKNKCRHGGSPLNRGGRHGGVRGATVHH